MSGISSDHNAMRLVEINYRKKRANPANVECKSCYQTIYRSLKKVKEEKKNTGSQMKMETEQSKLEEMQQKVSRGKPISDSSLPQEARKISNR